MSYASQATLAADATFRGTVKIALVTTARQLLTQTQAPEELGAVYQKRHQLALDILKNPDLLLDTAAWALASVPAITGTSTDTAIQNAVNTLLTGLIS